MRGLADPGLVPLLRVRLGTRLTVGGADREGRVEVEVAGPSVGMLVSELAGYGGRLLVVGPPEARTRLAEVPRGAARALRRAVGLTDRRFRRRRRPARRGAV